MSRRNIVSLKEANRFICDCLQSLGVKNDKAAQMAETLVAADHRGFYSHGLNRLEYYVNDIRSGMCNANADPKIEKETPATALVDGMNGLGPVIGNFSMKLAMEKARNFGIGWVVAHASNHYGIAGWYSELALEHGLMGISMTNTSPIMGPTGSKEAAIGTNPIAFAAPSLEDDRFSLDMATTQVSVGKIEMKRRNKEPIPNNWAQDSEGKPTTDPEIALRKDSSLQPLGGYKGYGLSMLVEILTSVLTGSTMGPHIRKWGGIPTHKADLAQCFIAIDPKCFNDGFEERLANLQTFLRNVNRADDSTPVVIPGDLEKQQMEEVDKQGGIDYPDSLINASEKLALELQVKPLSLLK